MSNLSFTQFADQVFLKVTADVSTLDGQKYKFEVVYIAPTQSDVSFGIDQIANFVLKSEIDSVTGTRVSISKEIVPAPAEYYVKATKKGIEGSVPEIHEFLIVKKDVAEGRAPFVAVKRDAFDAFIFQIPPANQLSARALEVLAQQSAFARIDPKQLAATSFGPGKLVPPTAKAPQTVRAG